jgi:hypothetical protein
MILNTDESTFYRIKTEPSARELKQRLSLEVKDLGIHRRNRSFKYSS